MNQTISFSAAFLFASVLTVGCVDYDDATRAVSVDVQLVAPEEFTAANAGLEGRTVVITKQDGMRLAATTDASGQAHFAGIVPDVYAVSTSWDLTAGEYAGLTGDNVVNEGAVVSGNINSQLLAEDRVTAPLQLATQLSINRSIVIGKVYYAGTKDNNKKNYLAGRYIELYNQSDHSVDVAGLYVGLVETNSSPAYTLAQLKSEYADSVVMLKQVFRIPVDKPVEVVPGGTVVITNSAIDHTVNASTDPNLLTADFEAKDERGRTVNNPAVRALELKYTTYAAITNMNLSQGGPGAVVIFRTDADVTSWPLAYDYGKTKGNQWLVAPKRYMLDAVEVLKYKATGTDIATKRFYDDLDAGYITIRSAGGYTGEVVYRKTSSRKGKDGHRILLDTNNSSNDFQVSTTIGIREYDE